MQSVEIVVTCTGLNQTGMIVSIRRSSLFLGDADQVTVYLKAHAIGYVILHASLSILHVNQPMQDQVMK